MRRPVVGWTGRAADTGAFSGEADTGGRGECP